MDTPRLIHQKLEKNFQNTRNSSSENFQEPLIEITKFKSEGRNETQRYLIGFIIGAFLMGISGWVQDQISSQSKFYFSLWFAILLIAILGIVIILERTNKFARPKETSEFLTKSSDKEDKAPIKIVPYYEYPRSYEVNYYFVVLALATFIGVFLAVIEEINQIIEVTLTNWFIYAFNIIIMIGIFIGLHFP